MACGGRWIEWRLGACAQEDDGLDILPRPVRAALGNITGATEVQP